MGRFPNTMCLTSSNDNGTCYTQQVSYMSYITR